MTDETIEGLAAVLYSDELIGYDRISLEPVYTSRRPPRALLVRLRLALREEALDRRLYHVAALLVG